MVDAKTGAIKEWLYRDPSVPTIPMMDQAGFQRTGREVVLQAPIDEATIRSLKVGDVVLLNGPAFTGRDAVDHHLVSHDPTPYGASTTTSPAGKQSIGQTTWKKNMAAIAVAHGTPYVATCNPYYYLDLMNKAKKASLVEGPAYLHIYSPCPTGWQCNPEEALTTARLAVQTKIFPLYEVIDGKCVMSRKISKPKPVSEYFAVQRRFRHLGEADIAYIQQRIDDEYNHLLLMAGETPGGEGEGKEE